MEKINDILNFVGDFTVAFDGKNIHLLGCLTSSGQDVVLECRATEQTRCLINSYESFQVYGNVAEVEVTLLNCYVSNAQLLGLNCDAGKFTFKPSEIVVGRSQSGEVRVLKMSASINTLNMMFSNRALEFSIFNKENPSILKYAFPKAIFATDLEGEIRIERLVDVSSENGSYAFKVVPYIEYTFNEPTEIHAALAKISSIRNLLVFFADHYLPFDQLTFSDNRSPYDKDCLLHLNFIEDIEGPDYPFFIRTNAFADAFQDIWTRWQTFYKESKHIAALFYEMICNHSRRTNLFLNLCQCLEIYSCYYREAEAKKIHDKHPDDGKKVALKHRLEDLLLAMNQYLMLPEDKCVELAKTISDSRNFFTHYSKKRKEPSCDCIAYSCEFLRFVLLLIIYNMLGIPDEYILDCKNRTPYKNMAFFISKIT